MKTALKIVAGLLVLLVAALAVVLYEVHRLEESANTHY